MHNSREHDEQDPVRKGIVGVEHDPLAQFAGIWDAGYARLERMYERTLRASLHVRWLVVVFAIASFAGGIMLVTTGLLSTEFLPRDDSGRIELDIEMPAGTPLAVTSDATRNVESRLMQVPEVDKVFTTVGGSGSRFAQLYVILKDKKERQRGSQAVADDARAFGQDIPGMTLKATPLSSSGRSDSAEADPDDQHGADPGDAAAGGQAR